MAQKRAGLPITAFYGIVRAEAIFPLKYYIRESAASTFFIADRLPPALILAQLDHALKADPHSPRLLWYTAMQQIRMANLTDAAQTIKRLEKVGRGWKQTKNARAVYEAVKAKLDALREERMWKNGPT